MIREIRTGGDYSHLNEETTKGLGNLKFYHPMGTFSLTPASNILLKAIIDNQNLFSGIGIDWGCGVGCLALLAARIKSVRKIYGLDISEQNIDAAVINTDINNLNEKVHFMIADSYKPYSPENRAELERLKGKFNFILANPPSSHGDDGFEFRRTILKGSKDYLIGDGIVLLNISLQYGIKRVESLCNEIEGVEYLGITASSGFVPFDLSRPDLLDCLNIYAREEQNGGYLYSFGMDGDDDFLSAQEALDLHKKTGRSPLTKWQTHIFINKA
ncbi:MAG: methyltransferase [Deltaproteobacteria bacterium]|nr:methyltransferase [Deltaproteobacteria bacterium]